MGAVGYLALRVKYYSLNHYCTPRVLKDDCVVIPRGLTKNENIKKSKFYVFHTCWKTFLHISYVFWNLDSTLKQVFSSLSTPIGPAVSFDLRSWIPPILEWYRVDISARYLISRIKSGLISQNFSSSNFFLRKYFIDRSKNPE